jgi:predicted nucleic acid-binding protein
VTIVLDASALLRFLDDEAGAERVERLLNQAASGEAVLLMSAVNWGEVIYAVTHRQGVSAAAELLRRLSSLRITIIPCSSEDAMQAALFKAQHKIPYADAFAASLAIENSATLLTADYDFKNLPAGTLKIEFLPSKS